MYTLLLVFMYTFGAQTSTVAVEINNFKSWDQCMQVGMSISSDPYFEGMDVETLRCETRG